ncbi:MAG: M6 family metalloprotease domain-containing protein [Euryarchaeota archaeon]|nr:M6 family metalloprotease domain-containing protein [Euryarchaeota archaeon]
MPASLLPVLVALSCVACAAAPVAMGEGAGHRVRGAGDDGGSAGVSAAQNPASHALNPAHRTLTPGPSALHPAPRALHPSASHWTPASVLSWASPSLVPPNPAVYRGRADIPPSTEPAARLSGPVSGPFTVLVLLIEFQDVVHAGANAPGHFENELFDTTVNSSSVNRYFDEVSYGRLSVQGEVTTLWLKSNRTMEFYGADGPGGPDSKNGPIYALVTEAVRAADEFVDFSRFDGDLDGYVDHLCVVHAGEGQESSTDRNNIWSHRWYDFDEPAADGVTAGFYTMLSEHSPVGVFAHELAHDMGLPDLYDYGYDSFGAGSWDLMATGAWADGGNTPVHLSAWCKSRLGWLAPELLTDARANISIPRIEDGPVAYRLDIRPPREYFLIENRQKTGWDRHLPGSGLLIWHIDEGVPDNDDQSHRLVDLEEADEAVNGDSPVQATDPWSDSPQGFNPGSRPDSSSYDGAPTGYWVHGIGPSGDLMNFSVRTATTDVAVTAVTFPDFTPVDVNVALGATVRFLTGKQPVDVNLSCTVMRGDVVFSGSTEVLALRPGAFWELEWSWTPAMAGNYIVSVSAAVDGDGVPENNERSGVLRVISHVFIDDVENGTGGWEAGATVPFVPGLWHIVNSTDRYGDARSPTHSWWCGYDGTGRYRRGADFIGYYLESPLIDLSRLGGAVLAFQQSYDLSTGLPAGALADTGTVEGSANLGATWRTLGTISGNGGGWGVQYYDLSGFTGSLFKFRLVLRSNVLMMGRGWYVDDLAVYATGSVHEVVTGISPSSARARPLEPVAFDLTVSNAGNREDTFQLTWAVPGSVSVALNTTTVRLGLFESARVRVLAGISGRAEAGTVLELRFTATSSGNRAASSTAAARLLVLQEHLLSLEAGRPVVHAGPGENAIFLVNVTNLGNGNDTVAFSAGGEGGGLATLAVPGRALRPWELFVLEAAVAVPGNASAGTELRFDITARSSGGFETSIPLRVTVDRTRGVTLSADAPAARARPGGHALFGLTLRNLGNGREDFTITVDAPAGWLAAHEVVVTVPPFGERAVPLDIAVPADAPGGRTTLAVSAAAPGGTPGTLTLAVDVTAPDLYLEGLRIEPQLVDEGGTVTLRVTVGNSGTANATAVTVTVFDNGKRLRDTVVDRLEPGSSQVLTFRLKLARGSHQIAVVASTPDRELSSGNNQLSGDARVRAGSGFIGGFDPAAMAAALAVAVLLFAAAAARRGPRGPG